MMFLEQWLVLLGACCLILRSSLKSQSSVWRILLASAAGRRTRVSDGMGGGRKSGSPAWISRGKHRSDLLACISALSEKKSDMFRIFICTLSLAGRTVELREIPFIYPYLDFRLFCGVSPLGFFVLCSLGNIRSQKIPYTRYHLNSLAGRSESLPIWIRGIFYTNL